MTGNVLIDDFGYWEGARKAVEEYFAAIPVDERPLLVPIDRVGRAGMKP